MDEKPGKQARPQYSADGKWWWDGQKWMLAAQRPAWRPNLIVSVGLGALVVMMGLCTVAVVRSPDFQRGANAGAKAAAASSTPTPTATATARPSARPSPTPTHAPTPIPPTVSPRAPATAVHLTAAQKDQVQAILQGSIDHYDRAFADGRAVLGTTRYADGFAGVAAMDDPNSAAARFRDWRGTSKVEQDVQTYLDAFSRADKFYTAETEPTAAISAWSDDMAALQGAISQWINVAVDWQINTKTDADLHAAADKVSASKTAAGADVATVIAQS